MAPNSSCGPVPTGVLSQTDTEVAPATLQDGHLKRRRHPGPIVWRNVVLFSCLHLASLYGIYLVFTSAKLLTTVWAYVLYFLGRLGITAGAHRLWSHRSYKAKWPLRVILAFLQTVAFQNDIYEWCRDHRVHHKYSETEADPHDARRGFFFSHMGWLLLRKHPQVTVKGKRIDLSDLTTDPIVHYQRKFYAPLMVTCCFLMPTLVPWYIWGDSLWNCWFVAALLRYCLTLHATWLVNSVAHMWGNKPYDRHINPAENVFVAINAIGEGWHNYHHVFPWDYKTAELANYRYNITTAVIDFFARIGWAYDLKTVKGDTVERRVKKSGDGSHPLWGWGDTDLKEE